MRQRTFQAGGPLGPGNAAFAAEIYGASALTRFGLTTYAPRIIASPRLTGKTTELFHLRRLRDQLSRGRCRFVEVIVPPTQGGIGEAGLRRLLGAALACPPTLTLPDMLAVSAKTRGPRDKLLAIREADNLTRGALMWLLRNLKILEEGQDVCPRRSTQVVVDGSVALDSLAGPRAPFPVQGLAPAEFSRSEQEEFVRTRARSLGREVPYESQARIWSQTEGDKYLTQAICLRLFDSSGARSVSISPGQVDRAARDYVDTRSDCDPLFTAIEYSARIWTRRNESADWVSDTTSISEKWWSWTDHQRKLAYAGGFVRRSHAGNVVLRAPVLADAIKKIASTRRSVMVTAERRSPPGANAPPAQEARAYVNAWLLGESRRTLQVGEVHVLCISVGDWRVGNLLGQPPDRLSDRPTLALDARFDFIVSAPQCAVTPLRSYFVPDDEEPARFELSPRRVPASGQTQITIVVCRQQALLHVATLNVEVVAPSAVPS